MTRLPFTARRCETIQRRRKSHTTHTRHHRLGTRKAVSPRFRVQTFLIARVSARRGNVASSPTRRIFQLLCPPLLSPFSPSHKPTTALQRHITHRAVLTTTCDREQHNAHYSREASKYSKHQASLRIYRRERKRRRGKWPMAEVPSIVI